ncbi:MAG: M3 family oligoendopeptidase [bacterium]
MNKTTWDLSSLFASDSDPKITEVRAESEKRVHEFASKWQKNQEYLKNTDVLFEALTEYEKLNREYGTGEFAGFYFWLRSVQDQNNSEVRGKLAEVTEWGTKLGNEIQFFSMNVSKLAPEMRAKVLSDSRFAPFRHYLERAFIFADHLLSEPEEKLLNLKSAPSHTAWVEMTERLLSKEEREVLTEDGTVKKVPFSALSSMISSTQKPVRDSAAAGINDMLAKLSDVAESEVNAILADKKINDELRHYSRPDQGRHLSDDVASEVVDALVAAVSKRNDISARYYVLKAKLLGLPKLAYHERTVEYGKLPSGYSYDSANQLVEKVLSGLDAEFAEIFKRFVVSNQIDALPRAGKESGAFCATQLLSTPTYILTNFTGKLRDVTTIAHEVGHGINNELMRAKQNSLSFGTPTSTAEVASTFMEDFVLEELEHSADDEARLALMMAKLNDDVSSIFRQVACYKFETNLHTEFRAKGYLSKEEIGKIFLREMAAYMGDAVTQDPGSENWWVYWSHIRRFFYVYSYASGLLISKSLQHSVRADKKFIGKVKEFLSAGTCESPKDIFARLGVDIADAKFWEAGIAEVENLLNETEILAKKLGKI